MWSVPLFFSLAAASVVLQAPPELMPTWAVNGPAPKDKLIQVNVFLKRDNKIFYELERVSTPESADFRRWLSKEETDSVLAASVTSPAPVVNWLAQHGVQDITMIGANTTIQFSATVEVLERMFETKFVNIREKATRKQFSRAGVLHAPKEVAAAVAAVFGVHGIPTPPPTKRPTRNATDIFPIGPTQLRNRYRVTGRGSGNLRNRQAVAEFQGQFANAADLVTFFQDYVPNFQPGDDVVYKFMGNNGSGTGIEALLDIQYIMGVAPGIKTEFWAWSNYDFCSDLVTWTSLIIDTTDVPLVFSISYGWQGPLSQLGCTTNEIQAIDANFATITARGISIIFASGDTGSAFDGNVLWPSWPASSPYVTSVGATCFTSSAMNQEMASTQFGSGSGFSTMFPTANFQKNAVDRYLQNAPNLPPPNVWTRTGRATPDVAALGEGYNVIMAGSPIVVGGTSASTPDFAAQVALINDALLAAGKRPLGYLNPWIYTLPQGTFTDITLGSDKIDRNGSPLQYGFECTAGWDPVTGLGTPLFDRLKAAALARGA